MPDSIIDESDFCVLVWKASKSKKKFSGIDTYVVGKLNSPAAFRIADTKSIIDKDTNVVLADENTYTLLIEDSTIHAPVLLPVPFARSILGWSDFHFSEENLESKL